MNQNVNDIKQLSNFKVFILWYIAHGHRKRWECNAVSVEKYFLGKGPLNNHVDKRGWVDGLKLSIFCPLQEYKFCLRRWVGGQKWIKLCPRSY